VVPTLSVAEPVPPAATLTGLLAPKLTVGTSIAPCGLEVTTAASVTLPLKPFVPPIVKASVPLAPGLSVTVVFAGVNVIPGAAPTVSDTVVVAVRLPEVPVIVTVVMPVAALALAVNVNTLEPVAGFVPNVAVTPPGSPVATSVTLPLKPFTPVTFTVSVAFSPCTTETAAAVAASVKLGGRFTVNEIVVKAVRLPEVPVTVTVAVPAVAVLEAISVNTLEPVAGFVPNPAVTPAGKPLAARATLPVKPLAPVMLTVSVTLAPCTTATAAVVGASVKLGAAFTVSDTVVEAVRVPEVPEIVTVAVPVVAVLVAVKVMPLEPVAGFVPNPAVTPAGSPVAVSVTEPVNP
jgi:hypothetical protein